MEISLTSISTSISVDFTLTLWFSFVISCHGRRKEKHIMSVHKHLTLEDRITIQKDLDNSSSRKFIADTIGKDKSTVCKEMKLHSFSKRLKRHGLSPKGTYDCIHIKQCGFKSLLYFCLR